jgi:hypothetical protein
MDAIQVSRDEIARQVTAIQFTVVTITDCAFKTELGARGVHERQRFSGHGKLVSKKGKAEELNCGPLSG